jgi:uncharacterized protein (TIGR00251 family)
VDQAKTRARIAVKAQPGAKKTELAEKVGGIYKVRLAAPPVDGKANEALIRFLAGRFDVPPSAVRIIRGLASRTKVIEIDGVDEARVERVLDNEH